MMRYFFLSEQATLLLFLVSSDLFCLIASELIALFYFSLI